MEGIESEANDEEEKKIEDTRRQLNRGDLEARQCLAQYNELKGESNTETTEENVPKTHIRKLSSLDRDIKKELLGKIINERKANMKKFMLNKKDIKKGKKEGKGRGINVENVGKANKIKFVMSRI